MDVLLPAINVIFEDKPDINEYYDCIYIEGSYAYIAGYGSTGERIGKLFIYSIDDKANPVRGTTTFDLPSYLIFYLTLENGYVYIANHDGGLQILGDWFC